MKASFVTMALLFFVWASSTVPASMHLRKMLQSRLIDGDKQAQQMCSDASTHMLCVKHFVIGPNTYVGSLVPYMHLRSPF